MKTIQKLFDLTGKVAVITGGAGFLGVQHARALLEAGSVVNLWDISLDKLNTVKHELEKQFPNKIFTAQVDITNADEIKSEACEIEAQFKRLDILINNAGMTVARGQEKFKKYFNSFETYPIELWEMALQVNLTGTFLVTQNLSALLKKSGNASIINIASDVGVISPDHRIYKPNHKNNYEGVSFNSPLSYATSKAALIHMTKFWATYWAKEGIRVNAISPAGVENSQDPKFVNELVERIPMGRMAKSHELKGAIVYLASEASSFVTGINLMVDGGRTVW